MLIHELPEEITDFCVSNSLDCFCESSTLFLCLSLSIFICLSFYHKIALYLPHVIVKQKQKIIINSNITFDLFPVTIKYK